MQLRSVFTWRVAKQPLTPVSLLFAALASGAEIGVMEYIEVATQTQFTTFHLTFWVTDARC